MPMLVLVPTTIVMVQVVMAVTVNTQEFIREE